MTSVPYPTFDKIKPVDEQRAALVAAGRCRIHCNINNNSGGADGECSYQAILAKCIEQGSAVDATQKLQKKYMKQGVAMASEYLTRKLQLDVSVIDVEVLVSCEDVIASQGCLASCFLDAGCARIVLPLDDDAMFQEAAAVAGIPRERLVAHTADVDLFPTNISSARAVAATVSVHVEASDDKLQEALSTVLAAHKEKHEPRMDVVAQFRPSSSLSDEVLAEMVGSLCKKTDHDTTGTTISLMDPTVEQLGLSYAACCKTDRDDGLYSTVVCTRSGEALGLVYSSKESIVAALQCGLGVYYSRSRKGLWRKGDTSGHHQTLHRIDVDCDGDALRFTVTQRSTQDSAPAFCHLNTLTCWGAPRGLRHLEETLAERLKSAPEGSYTKRLFDDEALLQEKLVEEAQELAEAGAKEHVTEELADILYFCMVRAAKAGVGIDDAVAELDRRTRKVTRRRGDSKAFRIEAGKAILEKAKEKK